MAHRGAAVAPDPATGPHGGRDDTARRRAGTTAHVRHRSSSPLADTEPEVGRCLRAVAGISRFGREPPRTGLIWSDERRTTEGIARLRRHELAPRLRSILHLESDEDAEALLSLDLEWLRYPRAEDTADVAALLPPDLHELRLRAPLLRTPRWRRLRLVPPRAAP